MRVYGLLVAVLLTVGVSNAAAQTSPYFGVKAGVNFAKINFEADGEDDDDFNDELDRRMGLVAGLFMVYPIRDTFGFQVEGLFSQKGAKIDEGGFEASSELDYFEVPVLARFSVPSTTGTSFHVYAGPSFGFQLRARGKSSFEGEDDEDVDIGDEFESFDLGLAVGAGVEFGRLVVDGRYTHGLSNINKLDDGVEAKNRVFSIMAGFRF